MKYFFLFFIISPFTASSQDTSIIYYARAEYISVSPFSTDDSLIEGIKEINQFIALHHVDSAYRVRAALKFYQDYYSRRGEYADAIADCDTAIRLNPNNSNLYRFRAYLRACMEDIPGALSDDSILTTIDPSGDGYYQRGIIYRSFHQYYNALKEYNKQIYLDLKSPHESEYYLVRADVKYDLRDYDGVLKDLDTSLTYAHGDCEFCFDLILKTYIEIGHPENACPYLIKATALGYTEFDRPFQQYCKK